MYSGVRGVQISSLSKGAGLCRLLEKGNGILI